MNGLNCRKNNFDYGSIEVGNRSEEIRIDHLNKTKLNMSASEMLFFVKYFPLMIGDFIPEGDEVWYFLLTCIKILEIVLQYEISENDIIHLNNLVKQHNLFYVNKCQRHVKIETPLSFALLLFY